MAEKVRMKWEFNDSIALSAGKPSAVKSDAAVARDLAVLKDIIAGDSIVTYFQPVFNTESGSVMGYEALMRTNLGAPYDRTGELFQKAIRCGCLRELDCACVTTAVRTAHRYNFSAKPVCLFVNICPETLMDNGRFIDVCDTLMEALHIPREKIVLEITEESMISNYGFFRQSLERYRRKGYRIAIDDFGAGYCGLKMLSTIEPHFVKIDRHFIASIDRAIIKYNLVDAIATACHRIGINVVAEGIERAEELSVLQNIGVNYVQGFYLSRPSPEMNEKPNVAMTNARKEFSSGGGEPHFIGDIASRVEPIAPADQVMNALKRFTENPDLRALPVVDKTMVVGMLHRGRFLENHIIGKHGYGYAMNTYKTVDGVMEKNFFLCEANTTIDELSRRIRSRESALQYDDICVTRTGKYYGTVAISLLLNAITERNIILAKGCNPLTGLPGNDFIQREIASRLAQNMHFDVAYIDIDHFKPFNDHYGFEKGDQVIKALAAIITDVLARHDSDSFNFAGHIGGDDFIAATRPQRSLEIAEEIAARFRARLPVFHGSEDFERGSYTAMNRRGETEDFRLLSLSIGIVSTEVSKMESYPQLASYATEVKKMAKTQTGFAIVRDRRLIK
ncbi:MAG TPA: bifunctional diguanylate cyclase/phosphodiesterase [Geobacteraceae bacterium]|nr:bifunctional diguanylate cyclase/phosphodiesterase [Geobacteraceae bacterium]